MTNDKTIVSVTRKQMQGSRDTVGALQTQVTASSVVIVTVAMTLCRPFAAACL